MSRGFTNFGFLLTGAWFISHGVIVLLNVRFSGMTEAMAILAVAAGASLISQRT